MGILERDIIRQRGAFIADALGDDWKVDTSAEFDHAVDLIGPDGQRIFVRNGVHPHAMRGRLIISGTYPMRAYRPKRVEITVKADRDPAQIATEIRRRLLPEYVEELARVREQIAAEDRAAGQQAVTMLRLAPLMVGGNMPDDGRDWWYSRHGVSGKVRVSHDGSTVNLDLHSVPADKAEAILRILGEGK